MIAGIAVAGLCGLFNGFLVAKMKIQPMVATLIFFTAGRAIGLLLTNNKMVYVHLDEFKVFGGKLWIFPTPTLIAAACILIMALILKTTSLGMYVQSVGINPKASRIAGINSVAIILLCYVICGLFSGVAGSCTKTSVAKYETCPLTRASYIASSSTTSPRASLTNTAPGFEIFSVSRLIISKVSGTSGTKMII